MTSRNKNIFAFATLTATAALGTALFAAGCGDSGDTTPAYPGANAARTINLKFTDIKDTLKAGKVDTLACVITKADGTRLYKTSKNVEIKNVPADKSAKSGKIDVNKDTYATFILSDTEFKDVRSEAATITAVYYNSKATGADEGKILGFSQDPISWRDTDDKETSDNDKKSYGEVDKVSFFLDATDVNHILSADHDIIGKDKTTKLAYEVKAKDGKQANIIDFVTVDGGKYLTKDDTTIVGQYKGAEYTEADGIQLVAEFNGGELKSDKPVYVTDAKIASITVKQKYDGVLLPEKITGANAVDYALGMTEVKGTNGSAALVTYGVGQTTMTAEVAPGDWKVEKDKGVAPKKPITLDEGVTYVANVGTAAAKADEATVDGNKISFLQVGTFEIVGTYKTDLAEKDGQVSGKVTITPVQPAVKIGLSTESAVQAQDTKIATFTDKIEGETGKEKSEALKMYAQFAPGTGAVGAFTSILFAIPESASFTYPSVAGLYAAGAVKDDPAYTDKFVGGTFDGKYKAEIVGADKQKTNDYTITVREAGLNLEVGFGDSKAGDKYAGDQTAAFGNYKNLKWQGVTIK